MPFGTIQANTPPSWDAPATGGGAITVHDTTADPNGPFRALWVGAAGNVKVTTYDGTAITLIGVPAGTLLPIAVLKVFSTGTTVSTPNTNITGLK